MVDFGGPEVAREGGEGDGLRLVQVRALKKKSTVILVYFALMFNYLSL